MGRIQNQHHFSMAFQHCWIGNHFKIWIGKGEAGKWCIAFYDFKGPLWKAQSPWTLLWKGKTGYVETKMALPVSSLDSKCGEQTERALKSFWGCIVCHCTTMKVSSLKADYLPLRWGVVWKGHKLRFSDVWHHIKTSKLDYITIAMFDIVRGKKQEFCEECHLKRVRSFTNDVRFSSTLRHLSSFSAVSADMYTQLKND